MATPEAQNKANLIDGPTPAEQRGFATSDNGNTWWSEFARVERGFAVLGGLFVVAVLVAYLGSYIENHALLLAGVVAFSLASVAMASLFFPLSWILLKGFLAWRRRRASERAQKI